MDKNTLTNKESLALMGIDAEDKKSFAQLKSKYEELFISSIKADLLQVFMKGSFDSRAAGTYIAVGLTAFGVDTTALTIQVMEGEVARLKKIYEAPTMEDNNQLELELGYKKSQGDANDSNEKSHVRYAQ